MRAKLIAVLLITALFSCSTQDQFPELISEKLPESQFTVEKPFFMAKPKSHADSFEEVIGDDLPGELIQMKELYEKRDQSFDLNKMELFWNDVKIMHGVFTFNGIKQWIDATGFLLEITGNAKYAAELERIQYQPNYIQDDPDSDELKSLLEPYIFTRNNDYFHVNLFANASVQFEHSLFGHVKITEETDFPSSGDINLKFNMEEKRFMEIFLRIPEWAEGATVTMKNVKYIAPLGDYCQIAKTWEEGDLVEIHFPLEKMPSYFLTH